MAKRNNDITFGSDRAKVRVFFAELEGGNESVQEALRTMASAMSRPGRVVSEPRTLPAQSSTGPQPPEQDEIDQGNFDFEEAEAATSSTNQPSPRKMRGTGKKIDRNASLKLVPDLDFRPNGKPIFKEFASGKSVDSDVDAVTVAVYFLQHMMEVEKIGPSHVMTAFKEIGRPVPADLKQTNRNIQNSRMWIKFSDIDEIRMTTQGDNRVEHEMGRGG